jgi:hypothetical protein
MKKGNSYPDSTTLVIKLLEQLLFHQHKWLMREPFTFKIAILKDHTTQIQCHHYSKHKNNWVLKLQHLKQI